MRPLSPTCIYVYASCPYSESFPQGEFMGRRLTKVTVKISNSPTGNAALKFLPNDFSQTYNEQQKQKTEQNNLKNVNFDREKTICERGQK